MISETVTKQVNKYEHWHTASDDKDMRRCDCWSYMRVNYDGLAYNNGWHDTDKAYPHADHCDNPNK